MKTSFGTEHNSEYFHYHDRRNLQPFCLKKKKALLFETEQIFFLFLLLRCTCISLHLGKMIISFLHWEKWVLL